MLMALGDFDAVLRTLKGILSWKRQALAKT